VGAPQSQRLLTAAGAETAHVYGHSMGGRIAQWLAIDHPQCVGALILAATSGGRLAGAGPSAVAMEALVSGDASRLAPLFFDPEWTANHPEAVRTFFNSRATAWAKSRHFRASREHDAWSDLGAIDAPTLILHGTDDALTPLANGIQLHQHIRRSTLIRVPGAGHGLHLDRPETIQWIRQFIGAKAPHILV
jgi:pimeloyl-ACP methyl ester carboxylesterase